MSKAGQHLIYGGITEGRPVQSAESEDLVCNSDRRVGATGMKVIKVEEVEAAVRKLSNSNDAGCLDLIV